MHPFDGTWSPICASYALRRVAIDHKTEDNEEACKAIERNFYEDDFMKSTKTEADAILLVYKLIELLERGGFALNKWLSNSRTVLQSIPLDKRAESVKDLSDKLVVLPLERILGMFWNVETDVGFYINQANKPHTRRGALSVTCSIFDPCVFLAPFVLKEKMLIQELTRMKPGWDEPIPRAEDEMWQCWEADLGKPSKFKVKRALKPASLRIKHSAVQSEKGVSFRAITNFHFEKNKNMNFAVFLKHHLCCIALNNLKFYTFINSFIIYLMI